MKKKILTVLLATAMMVFAVACGSSDNESAGTVEETTSEEVQEQTQEVVAEEEAAAAGGFALDGTWPAETIKIGMETYDVTDAQFLAMQRYYEYLSQYFNIEIMYSESIASAEDELKFIENCAAAGCVAVIGTYNVTEAEVAQLCIDKGMYYWGSADKESVYSALSTNEFYLGSYDNGESDYDAGYAMAKTLIDQGSKKLVYASGGDEMGIDMFIQRANGFYAAVEEANASGNDIEIIKKVAGWPGTDAFTAAQTEVADMDFDGLGCSFTAAVWFQPLANVGKLDGSVKIATIGVIDDTYKDLVNAGVVSCIVYDCEEILWGSAIPMILNAVTGHVDATKNPDGSAANYPAPRWIVNSSEAYNAIYDTHAAGEYFKTAEDVASCIVEYNPQASYETLVETYGQATLDNSVE